MTERDPLRSHFDAFRDQSVKTARPPSVEEIPRRLRRNRRRRTVAVVAAAVALIALVALPSWRDSGPPPVPTTSPTPTPSSSMLASPSASVAGALPPAGAASSVGSTGSSSKAATCTTSTRGLPLINGRAEADMTTNGDNMLVPQPASFFELCPTIVRLPIVHLVYDWDAERKQYVLAYNASYALTRAAPSIPRPAAKRNPMSSCGGLETLLLTTRGVPSTIPRSVQDSAGPSAAAMNYLAKNGQISPYLGAILSYDDVTSRSYCQPTSPPA